MEHKKQARITILFILLLFTPVIFCVLPFATNRLVNDFRLWAFAKSLYDYPLPPETQVISRYKIVHRAGGGNHCDFEVVQQMETSLGEEEIREFYQNVKFPRVLGSKANGPALDFIFFEDSSYSSSKRIKEFFEDPSRSEELTAFVFSVGDIGHPPGFDFRCM